MSDTETSAPETTAEGELTRSEPVRALAAENAALAQRLRSAQIPQHVAMAAACRALALDLPGALGAQVEADLASGELAQRWQAARDAAAGAAGPSDVEPAIAAVAALLREHGRVAMRHLLACGKEWMADAHRLEGQAAALESQAERLRRVAAAEDARTPDAAEPRPLTTTTLE